MNKTEKTRDSVNDTATPFDIARAETQAEKYGVSEKVVKLRPVLPAPHDRLLTDRGGKSPPLGSPYWTERAAMMRADMIARVGFDRIAESAKCPSSGFLGPRAA